MVRAESQVLAADATLSERRLLHELEPTVRHVEIAPLQVGCHGQRCRRRVLAVVVHRDHHVAAHPGEAEQGGPMLAEVAARRNRSESDRRPRRVGRSPPVLRLASRR